MLVDVDACKYTTECMTWMCVKETYIYVKETYRCEREVQICF